MEYSEITHESVHPSKQAALIKHAALLNSEQAQEKGSASTWQPHSFQNDAEEFRMGSRGHIVWSLRKLPFK